ncbi:MAG: ornithine cyclodeaminase family protein [Gammaproteobacteria bacterium]
MKTTLLERDDVANIVRHVGLNELMDEAIDGIRQVCLDQAKGCAEVPQRSGFHYETPRLGLLEWMPAMRVGERIVIKMVGYHPRNPEALSLPTILSSVLVFDPASGHLDAVIDGNFLTALRTGAASALATRILMPAGAATLGLIGAGAQAVTQLHAISRVMPVNTVVLFDVDAATLQSFPARVAQLGLNELDLRVGTVAEAAACDVVCTATSVDIGQGPVLPADALLPNVHINAVGSDFPGKTELPLSVLERAVVCPDFTAQAKKEGECQQLDDAQIGPDLAAMVCAGDERWRESLTVFDSTGWALEDYVVAEMFRRHATAIGAGRLVELESISQDPKDPYGFLGLAQNELRVAR